MKVYEYIKIDMFAFQTIEEDSYEYFGVFDKCKGGEYAARREAKRAYQLQLDQMALQQAQLQELEDKEKNKKFNEQEILKQGLKRNIGRKSTILTDIQDFGTANVSKKSLYG